MFPTTIKMASIPAELIGITGKRYTSIKLLQQKPHIGCVWAAMCENHTFVLKDIPRDVLANFDERIHPRLEKNTSPFLRLPVDRIADRRTLVYNYMDNSFFQLVRQGLSLQNRRRVLKAGIEAIAALHHRDVVHLDIKPDNILVDCTNKDQGTLIEDVQLVDLENAAHLPDSKCVKGMLAGNENWRSPEAHFKGELSKPSDIFSFGLVCLYAMTGKVTCGPDEDFHQHESQGALPAMIRLQRQISYFGDSAGLEGLMRHVGDEEINGQILSMLWDEREAEHVPYKPFSTWPEAVDDEFRELIEGTMSLDPARRLTAQQILGSPWFSA